MIELSGLSVQDPANPEGDIAIELSGLRPGEKLYEELLLGELDLALQHNDVPTIRLQLQHLVPGYTPSDAIVDWVYLEQQAG